MSNKLTKKTRETFEGIRCIDENGNEFWTARDLYKVLEYTEYRNFLPAARKAWTACQQSGFNPNDHFVPFNDMVRIGSGAERQVDNIKMSRYACYLTVQNADPSKPIVAQTQTEEKLKKDNIKGKEKANKVHRQIGAKVRKVIEDIGGTMPEDLPVVESIKKLERKEKKLKQIKGDKDKEDR